MAIYITETGNGSTDEMKWKVSYHSNETSVEYYEQKEGDHTKMNVCTVKLGKYEFMFDVINNGLFNDVPGNYVIMIGDSLAAVQRVFNAVIAMKK